MTSSYCELISLGTSWNICDFHLVEHILLKIESVYESMEISKTHL